MRRITFVIAVVVAFACVPLPAAAQEPDDTVDGAIAWLKKEAHRIVRESLRRMDDGTAAFPPQVGIGYEAFWLRDYEYTLEGAINAYSNEELLAACRLFVRSLRGDGDLFYVVDHQNKKAYEDIDPAVIGSFGRFLQPMPMIEFLHETPYSDEINGKSRELKGFKEINGVDCYEIHVVYTAENAPPTIWFFGKEDFLPRCRVDEVMVEQGPEKFTQKRILANVVADPKLPADVFKLKLPDGYTKTDDFAP